MIPTREVWNNVDWFSAYITSISSGFGISGSSIDLPLPTVPESVSEQLSLSSSEQAILGRSAPIVTYSSTNARSISFSFAVADDYMPTNSAGVQYTIDSYVNALKSLVYPTYNSNEIISPQVVLKIGNIKIAGIVTSVSITWNGPLSNIMAGGCWSRADISVQVKEVRQSVLGAIDIRNGG